MQGEPCKQTQREETCMAMGAIAQTLVKMELGREISRSQAMEIIIQNQEEGLVLQPSNAQKIEFLCSCCGCCCSMLSLQHGLPKPLDFWESGFTVRLDDARCVGCRKCVEKCGAHALTLPVSKEKKERPAPVVDPLRCIGCGHCVAACKKGALSLAPRSGQAAPPKTREALNEELLAQKKNPLAPVRVIGKLAMGMVETRDFSLLTGSSSNPEKS